MLSILKGIIISWPTGSSTTFTVDYKKKKGKERILVKSKGQQPTVDKQMENHGTIFNYIECRSFCHIPPLPAPP